ncbi:MAG: response regulator, partial [bacterium]|nr:response regulator [bacterium]
EAPCALRTILDDTRAIFSRDIMKKKLAFHMDVATSLPDIVMMDEIRLREIFLNLVGNAVKFTRTGYIRLSVQADYRNANHTLADITLLVEDTGIGIPEDRRFIIFNAFKQLDSTSTTKYSGTGLGLSITKHLVEMMKGEISVDSVVGKGSLFRVFFKDVVTSPSAAPGPGESQKQPKVPVSVHFQDATVLVVDDIESNRMLLRGFLNRPGLSVIEAHNGKEAIEQAGQFTPDLIFMDLRMPVMDGYEAIGLLRKEDRFKPIPIIALSASAMKRKGIAIKKADCNGYLIKPITRKEIMKQLKRFLPYWEEPMAQTGGQVEALTASIESLSQETIDLLPELVGLLKNDFEEKFASIKKRAISDEIEAFSNEIAVIADKYNVELLAQWAKKLHRQVQQFELTSLPNTMEEFSQILKKLHQACGDVSGV